MTELLTVTRHPADGPRTQVHLTLEEDRYLLHRDATPSTPASTRHLAGATSPAQALRRSRSLRVARAEDRTEFECPAPELLAPETVRIALRVTGSTAPDQAENASGDPADESEGEWTVFDEADVVWSTRHDLTLDGEHLYGIPTDGLVVTASDYRRPYEDWPEIVWFSWDSSDYAGVGMAGFGTSGVFRPHPGLLATVETDESISIGFERISPSTLDATLVALALHADIFGDRLWPHLILSAYGYDSADLYPGDAASCALTTAQLRRALQCQLPAPPNPAPS